MSRYDVIIVGGGPAGATTALYAARRGLRPLLIDKKAFPRDKFCGDAVARKSLGYVRDLGLMNEMRAALHEPIDQALVGAPGGAAVRVDLNPANHPEAPHAVCRREIFDDVLFRAGDATEGGLVILSGQISLTKEGEAGEGERFKVSSLIGQRALLTTTKRRHTAVAVSPVEVMLIRRSLFLRMLSEYPDLAARLHAQLSAELNRLTDQAVAVVGDS